MNIPTTTSRLTALTEIAIGAPMIAYQTVINIAYLVCKTLSLHAFWENRNIQTDGEGPLVRSMQFLKDLISPIVYLVISIIKYLLQFVYLIKPLPQIDKKIAITLSRFDLRGQQAHIIKLRSTKRILKSNCKLLSQGLGEGYTVSIYENKLKVIKNDDNKSILITPFNNRIFQMDKFDIIKGLNKNCKDHINSLFDEKGPDSITPDPEALRNGPKSFSLNNE